MKDRASIDQKLKWDLTKFCRDEKDFFERLEKFKNESKKISDFEGKLSNDDVLFDCLKFQEKLGIEAGKISIYAHLKQSEDITNSKVNEMCEEFEKVATDYNILSSFVEVEISAFSDQKLKGLIANKRFLDYKRFFEGILREKKYVLSKKEEKLLSGMSFLGGFSDDFDSFDNGDLKFNKIKDKNGKMYELNHSTYRTLAESSDPELRKNTFCEFNGTYGRYINFLASNYISDVKADCYFSKIRGFSSCLQSSIFHEEASEDVYKTLIEKVRGNIKVFYHYMEIKRKVLGLKTISIADSFAPISKKLTKKYSYDEAIEIIKEAVKPLGEEYVKLIQRAKDERWIDVMPNKGKESGAFSTSTYGCTPVVLANFSGNLESVFTLAHELGHAMHSYFSNSKQKYPNADYVIFVAEVASTTNEMLLLRYLLSKAKTKKEKHFYYDKLMTDVKSTIFRQTMFSEFEEKIHSMYEKSIPLSKDRLCEEYYKLNEFYFGKRVKLYEEVKYEWARIPHFFSPFYVYKYATGLISAIYFSEKLFNKEKDAREKYLGFLSAGSSKDPISILKDAGCNLEDEKTFDNVFDFLREILKDWEKQINID